MKRPTIDPVLIQKVQKYANLHFDGNFTQAVNSILSESLEIRRVDNGCYNTIGEYIINVEEEK